jgi:hypothetical protein
MFYCTVHYSTKGEEHFEYWKFTCCNYARKLVIAFDINNSTYSEMKQVSIIYVYHHGRLILIYLDDGGRTSNI